MDPQQRQNAPDEIAKAWVFLASNDSSFVSGIELSTCGPLHDACGAGLRACGQGQKLAPGGREIELREIPFRLEKADGVFNGLNRNYLGIFERAGTTGASVASESGHERNTPKNTRTMKSNICICFLLSVLALALMGNSLCAQDAATRINNIVLVHGAWADGSGWKGVSDILTKKGYNVSVVQEPETSFQEDVAATKRILAQQNGPCILVGHSYGGAVITEAGTDPAVVGLVYIAAHMPDAGESEAADGARIPSELSKAGVIKVTPDGFTYIDPAKFPHYFAADVPAERAEFMARSQVLNPAASFKAIITVPAWRAKPSWMLVAGNDRAINPELERWYAERAQSKKIEVAPGASHAVYVSQPERVAALIEEAASSEVKGRNHANP